MGTLSNWEALLMGVMVLLIILWFRPGIMVLLEESRQAKKDWPGLLYPIAFVVLFIIMLITML